LTAAATMPAQVRRPTSAAVCQIQLHLAITHKLLSLNLRRFRHVIKWSEVGSRYSELGHPPPFRNNSQKIFVRFCLRAGL
jgi:hypothetical protein